MGGEMLWTFRNMIEVSSYHSLKYNNSGKGKLLQHYYRKQDQREGPIEFTVFLLHNSICLTKNINTGKGKEPTIFGQLWQITSAMI